MGGTSRSPPANGACNFCGRNRGEHTKTEYTTRGRPAGWLERLQDSTGWEISRAPQGTLFGDAGGSEISYIRFIPVVGQCGVLNIWCLGGSETRKLQKNVALFNKENKVCYVSHFE